MNEPPTTYRAVVRTLLPPEWAKLASNNGRQIFQWNGLQLNLSLAFQVEIGIQESWKAQCKDLVDRAHEWLVDRNAEADLINSYDNTNPLIDRVSHTVFVFKDRDTALLFKLAWETQ